MPDRRRARCKDCGRHRDTVGLLSWTGLCGDCGKVRLEENVDGLHTFSGEPLLRWRRGLAASVGAVLIDELPIET